MNFDFLNVIPDYFGQTANLINSIPFDFGMPQLPKAIPIIPPPNIINETKIQTFDTGNFQDFEFRAPVQSVLIAPPVETVSVIPVQPFIPPIITPIVQAPQAVPSPVWQPFYVPQIIQTIPTPSAPVIQNVQIVQPSQNFDAQFNDLKNQLATNATQQSDYIKTLTQTNSQINTGWQNKIELLARDNATNITNFNNTERASAQTISNLTSSLASTNNTVTQ